MSKWSLFYIQVRWLKVKPILVYWGKGNNCFTSISCSCYRSRRSRSDVLDQSVSSPKPSSSFSTPCNSRSLRSRCIQTPDTSSCDTERKGADRSRSSCGGSRSCGSDQVERQPSVDREVFQEDESDAGSPLSVQQVRMGSRSFKDGWGHKERVKVMWTRSSQMTTGVDREVFQVDKSVLGSPLSVQLVRMRSRSLCKGQVHRRRIKVLLINAGQVATIVE